MSEVLACRLAEKVNHFENCSPLLCEPVLFVGENQKARTYEFPEAFSCPVTGEIPADDILCSQRLFPDQQ